MYGNNHKLFLHELFRKGLMPLAKSLEFCKNLEGQEVSNVDSLRTFISVINKEIAKHEFKIVLSICEISGQEEVILISTANDDVTKLQNGFGAIQLEFFQRILLETVTSNDKKLTHIGCLNLATKLTGKLTHADAQRLIAKWVKMGYLVEHDSDIYLGSRCIVEFTSFFKAHCQDYIWKCNLCNELLFQGRQCNYCTKIYHTHCLEKYLEKHNYCPECKNQWQDREIRTQDVSQSYDCEEGRESPQPSTSKRLRY